MNINISKAGLALVIALTPFIASAEKIDLKLVGQQGDMYFFTIPKSHISDQAFLLRTAEGFCFNKTFCYAQFWEAGKASPKRFPLTEKESALMVASYTSNQRTGKKQMLWKCSIFPKESKDSCFS